MLFIHSDGDVVQAPQPGDQFVAITLVWTVNAVTDTSVVFTHPLVDEPWVLGHDDFVELTVRRNLLQRANVPAVH